MKTPAVSVVMPAFNAEAFIGKAVSSVLGQSFDDFELIVIDDGSTDRTIEVLAQFADRRLRVLRKNANGGVARALNLGASAARGRYLARLDADDIAVPTRLARQVDFLERNPEVVLLGSRTWDIITCETHKANSVYHRDPAVLEWLLHLANPIGASTTMFRASILQRLGTFARDEFVVAEDFDFYHRALSLGRLCVLPDRLVLYRRHQSSLTGGGAAARLADFTNRVLAEAHRKLLGDEIGQLPNLIASLLMVHSSPGSAHEYAELGSGIVRLLDAYLARHPAAARQCADIERITRSIWQKALCRAVRRAIPVWKIPSVPRLGTNVPRLPGLVGNALFAHAPGRRLAKVALNAAHPSPIPRRTVEFEGRTFDPRIPAPAAVPTLYVVVDAEAEFDWAQPFHLAAADVRAMRHIDRAQVLCDRYGLRPVYVVDYPVASQPEGYEPLRRILDSGRCFIGAHLHPWSTPPFEEVINERNSYAGNLPPGLQEQKLRQLVAAIREGFGVQPLFFKAGRFGTGAHTYAILERLGFSVDLSILPGVDLREFGGPDLRAFEPITYQVGNSPIVSFPVTRACHGLAAWMCPPWVRDVLLSRPSRTLHVPGLLARLRLLDVTPLSPEGASLEEQIRLVRHRIARGQKDFFLVFHSPSLEPGHTPYVRSERDLAGFMSRFDGLLRFFFEELGGLPGNPADLLRPGLPDQVMPKSAA